MFTICVYYCMFTYIFRSNVSVAPPGGPPTGQMPPLLQRLMSNPGATVAEIERQQHSGMPRDQMPEPVGEEAPPGGINGTKRSKVSKKPRLQCEEPDSPNTALKRSLNILPPTHKSSRQVENGGHSSSRWTQQSHDLMMRTATAPSLLTSNIPMVQPLHPSNIPASIAVHASNIQVCSPTSSLQGLASRAVAAYGTTVTMAMNVPVSSTLHEARHHHRQIPPLEMFEPEIFMTRTVAPDAGVGGGLMQGQIQAGGQLSTERHPGQLSTERHPGQLSTERHPGQLSTERHPGSQLIMERHPGSQLSAERLPGSQLSTERHPGGQLITEGLITPQALLQSASTSLPSSMPSQVRKHIRQISQMRKYTKIKYLR